MIKKEFKAEQTYLRLSPRKVRLVAEAIVKLQPQESLTYLKFMPKKGSEVLYKLVKQAIANATRDGKIKESDLEFRHILAQAGPTLKRWRAASRGRGAKINKRTTHVKVILSEKTGGTSGKKG